MLTQMCLLLLLQSPSPAPSPVTAHPPEWLAALLTLIYVGAVVLGVLILALGLLRYRLSRARQATSVPDDLPKAVKRRLGATTTNRGLKALRFVFVVLAAAIAATARIQARYWPIAL